MNTSVNRNLAHESESQRQYARIKIPARLIMEVNGTNRRFQLMDLSAGGFAFQTSDNLQSVNGCAGRLEFNVDGFTFVMPVKFDIKLMSETGRVGCSFQNISSQEASSLRHIITAFLNGELVTAGDMINILGRDNFGKVRAKKSSKALEGFAKLKAIIGSVIFFCVGLVAFSFIAMKLWGILLVSHSSVAVVGSNSYSIKTPREGVINVLATKGSQVQAGQIIGTFASPLATFLASGSDVGGLNKESIKPLVSESYLGSLVSPCDCLVEAVQVVNGQYLEQGGVVFTLVPHESMPFVAAKFPSSDIQYLNIGKKVSVSVAGKKIPGTVENFSIEQDNNGHFMDTVKVLIRSDGSDLTGLVGLPAIASFSKYELPK